MYRKTNKIIASLLVIMLMFSYFSIIGEVFAEGITSIDENTTKELENQGMDTNNKNIKFDTFFCNSDSLMQSSTNESARNIESKTGVLHSLEANIDEANYIYFYINFQNAGYIKNTTINISNANFKFIEDKNQIKVSTSNSGSTDDIIANVEASKITLNDIDSIEKVIIQVPIQINKVETENEFVGTNFYKENKINFETIYVNEDGKSSNVKASKKLAVQWTANVEVKLDSQVSEFTPYSVNGTTGLVLQTIIKSNLTENKLPSISDKLEMTIPAISGIKPTSVRVTSTTDATNPNSNGTADKYDADIENGKLTITTNGPTIESDENYTYYKWNKGVQDEYIVTYIYPESSLENLTFTVNDETLNSALDAMNELKNNEDSEIIVNSNNEILLDIKNEIKTPVEKTATNESNILVNKLIGKLGDFTTQVSRNSLSKGKFYANSGTIEYNEKITAKVGLSNVINAVSIQTSADTLVGGSNHTLNNNYVKTVTINKSEFKEILGEDASLNIYVNGQNVYNFVINKEENLNTENLKTITVTEDDNNFVLDFTAANTNNISIVTSKPKTEGKLNFNITKVINANTGYTNTQINSAEKIVTTVVATMMNENDKIVEQTLSNEIVLTQPKSQAELQIENNNLSTVVTNENVKITAILKTDTEDCMLYKNPVLQITLPSYIEQINIKNIELLFDNNGAKLNLKDAKISQNLDGTKTIYIVLNGAQTEYTLGAVSKGLNVVITTDITLNKLTANRQDNVSMTFSNDNDVTLSKLNKSVGEGESSKETTTNIVYATINAVAPTGVITTSKISGYNGNSKDLTAMSGEEQTATIATGADSVTANIVMTVLNNYNNTVNNISILGRTMFKGNKNILTSENLGTTFDSPITGAITLPNVDSSKYTVYYSTNGDATRDVSNTSNGWTTTVTDYSTVKSYLIVFTPDYPLNTSESIEFDYSISIPAKMQYNESAFENYVVYFNNNLSTGIIEDKQASTKLGITTGRGPVIEASLSSDKSETEEMQMGNTINYTITVKNTGTETATNVNAQVELPEGLEYVAEDGTIYRTISAQAAIVSISIGNVEAGQSTSKIVSLKALNPTEETKTIELKATVGASNINGTTDTNAVKNTLIKTYYATGSSIKPGHGVLKEGDTFEVYMEITSYSSTEAKENTVLKVTLPEEIEYESTKIGNSVRLKETDITNSTEKKYDDKTRTLTINLGSVVGTEMKNIHLNLKVGKLSENVYDKNVSIQAAISGDGTKSEKIGIDNIEIGKPAVSVTQTCNIPEGSHIKGGENFTYTYTIENKSNIAMNGVKITDAIPTGLTFGNIEVTKGENARKYYNPEITIDIDGKETLTVKVNVSANIVDEATPISNKLTVTFNNSTIAETSEISHTIDKFENSDNSNGVDSQTKRIMGEVWADENGNGQKDDEEKGVSGVELLLFNNTTGTLARNSSGNVLRITTGEDGVYTFSGVRAGNYTVIFLYDTANYSATTYRKDGVSSERNSDAVDTKITLDGLTRAAAITEAVTVSNSNIYNIDLGLISNPKFDLKLDKTISKITVQDNTGTTTTEYNDSKLAKKDLVGKRVESTTIIVEYKIKVTNEGAISGYVKKIADYVPSELKFSSELNKDWYSAENGTIYNSSLANTVINPGETKEVTLILTKKMTDNNLGLYHNQAEIYEAYNDLGIDDIDSTPGNKVSTEDDISSADALISVKTGEVVTVTLVSTAIIAGITISAIIIKKKVIK